MLPDGQRLSLVLSNRMDGAKILLERTFISLNPSHSRRRGTFGRNHREYTPETTLLRSEVRDGDGDPNVSLKRGALSSGNILPCSTSEGGGRFTQLFSEFRNDSCGTVPRVCIDEQLTVLSRRKHSEGAHFDFGFRTKGDRGRGPRFWA